MTVLVVAAHPDDEVLGCGGTIAKLAQQGCDVDVLILGEGVTSRNPNLDEANRRLLEKLQSDSQRASEILGVRDRFCYQFPDNRFDTLPLLNVIKKIEEVIAKIKPDTVYTHHGGDLNIDHTVVHRATITATRPVPGCTVNAVYTYEVASSSEWAFGQFGQPFQPNVFVDISDTLDKKLQAMNAYTGEVHNFPHPRSAENLEAMAKNMGAASGLDAAEAFQLVRMIL